MEKIVLPREIKGIGSSVSKGEVLGYFEKSGKHPSIKEQLILKAYDMAENTKVIYESENITVLSSYDQTGTYLSCFNKMGVEVSLEIPLLAVGLLGNYIAYCVLTGQEIGILEDTLVLQIPEQGILLVKLLPVMQ